MSDSIKNLFGEEVPISEALKEMSKKPKKVKASEGDFIIIRGEKIPRRIYNLCVNNYLSIQYGEDY